VEQDPSRPAQGQPGDRPEQARRQQEEQQRAAHRHEQQCRHPVADRDVLEHVGRQQPVGGPIDRRGKRRHPDDQRQREQPRAPPAGQVAPAAPTQAAEAVGEGGRRDDRCRKSYSKRHCRARATASSCEWQPSRWSNPWTWLRTVVSESSSRSAISLTRTPSAMSESTCR
jgi:hypothetical protein